MNEALDKAIRIELGIDDALTAQFVTERSGLCHPEHEDNEIHSGEEFIGDTVLKTPISCGDYALIYNGHAVLGAVSEDQVYISGDGLKSPGRAEMVNELLTLPGHRLDPMTWIYHTGNDMEYVGNGIHVSGEGIIRDEGAKRRESPLSDIMAKRMRFYTEYIMEMIDVHGGSVQSSILQARDNGYAIMDEGGDGYYNLKSNVDSLIIPAQVLLDALDYIGIRKEAMISGRTIWEFKQCVLDIIYAVLDYPTQFKKLA